MSDRGIAQLLAFIRRRSSPLSDLVADGELLHRYTTGRDEAAFELLVRRHGPMVLGVAQRVVRESHAAEDVFQATFLTLARKAKSLRRHDALSGWLYRVALRIALRARTSSSVRARSIHVNTTATESQTPNNSLEWSELREILDEEVNKLPERFRTAVVLCYLSGKSTEDAAKEIGCPRGTILSRLANARKRLQGGLSRRGYAIPATLLASGLASETAPAALNANLVALAMKVIQPAIAVAPAVASLSFGVIHAMMMTKIKVAIALFLVAGAVGIGVGQLTGPGPAIADQVPKEQAKTVAPPSEISEEARRQAEDHRQKVEDQMIKHLQTASQRRIKGKMNIMELEDRIDEIRQNMAPLSKMLDQYLALQLDASMKLHEIRRARPGDDAMVKTQAESIDYLNTSIEEVRRKLMNHRGEMRVLRRQLLEVEEELALQEKISHIEVDRISRSMKR